MAIASFWMNILWTTSAGQFKNDCRDVIYRVDRHIIRHWYLNFRKL